MQIPTYLLSGVTKVLDNKIAGSVPEESSTPSAVGCIRALTPVPLVGFTQASSDLFT